MCFKFKLDYNYFTVFVKSDQRKVNKGSKLVQFCSFNTFLKPEFLSSLHTNTGKTEVKISKARKTETLSNNFLLRAECCSLERDDRRSAGI